MKTPTVAEFMTKTPFTIGAGQTLSSAHKMMRERRVRHLPVLEGGRLVGVVSQRDLYLLETIRGVDPEDTLVEEAMTGDPFVTSPDTSLRKVVQTLLEHRWGSAIVAEGAKVVGVFTTTDALKVILELLDGSAPKRAAGKRTGARRVT